MDKEPKSIWGKIKEGFNEGRTEERQRFEQKHGYPSDQIIRREIEAGRQRARCGRRPFWQIAVKNGFGARDRGLLSYKGQCV